MVKVVHRLRAAKESETPSVFKNLSFAEKGYIPALFYGKIQSDAPDDYSEAHSHKLLHNKRLTRKEELELPKKALATLDLTGKLVDLEHSDLVVGRIFGSHYSPETGSYWVAFAFEDTEAGRIVYEETDKGRLASLSLEHDNVIQNGKVVSIDPVRVAVCAQGARDGTYIAMDEDIRNMRVQACVSKKKRGGISSVPDQQECNCFRIVQRIRAMATQQDVANRETTSQHANSLSFATVTHEAVSQEPKRVSAAMSDSAVVRVDYESKTEIAPAEAAQGPPDSEKQPDTREQDNTEVKENPVDAMLKSNMPIAAREALTEKLLELQEKASASEAKETEAAKKLKDIAAEKVRLEEDLAKAKEKLKVTQRWRKPEQSQDFQRFIGNRTELPRDPQGRFVKKETDQRTLAAMKKQAEARRLFQPSSNMIQASKKRTKVSKEEEEEEAEAEAEGEEEDSGRQVESDDDEEATMDPLDVQAKLQLTKIRAAEVQPEHIRKMVKGASIYSEKNGFVWVPLCPQYDVPVSKELLKMMDDPKVEEMGARVARQIEEQENKTRGYY